LPYEDCHKVIDGVLYKLCNRCNEWFPCTEEYFYKTSVNTKDNLFPYCKRCNIKRSINWRTNNRDEWLEFNKKYNKKEIRKADIDRRRIKYREDGKQLEWQQNNKDRVKEYGEKRQHKKHNIKKKEWNSCKEYFNYECAYCGLSLEKHYVRFKGEMILSDFHREHVIDQGKNDLSNCVPSCKSCNSSKRNFTIEEWYNEKNTNYSQKRLNKIIKWINEDYKLFKT
jgi:hypothetical protein